MIFTFDAHRDEYLETRRARPADTPIAWKGPRAGNCMDE